MIAAWLFALALAGPPRPEPPPEREPEPAPLDCELGPVAKRYGESDWQVYGCADARSIVVVAVEGSLAFPFYFILTPRGEDEAEGEDVRLYGEGSGDNGATRAAYIDLDQLSPADVAVLYAETLAVARQP